MTFLELLLELMMILVFLTGAGALGNILIVSICSQEVMFKIWLKSNEFEGIKNPLKDQWHFLDDVLDGLYMAWCLEDTGGSWLVLMSLMAYFMVFWGYKCHKCQVSALYDSSIDRNEIPPFSVFEIYIVACQIGCRPNRSSRLFVVVKCFMWLLANWGTLPAK